MPLERRCSSARRPSAQSEDHDDESGEHEGRKQTERRDDVCVSIGKAPSDIPTLKPYWGKLTVRNFREGDGNVGIHSKPATRHRSTRPQALNDTYKKHGGGGYNGSTGPPNLERVTEYGLASW